MNPLTFWREELRHLIPRGFVRRDQGDGLLISDYPPRKSRRRLLPRALRYGWKTGWPMWMEACKNTGPWRRR